MLRSIPAERGGCRRHQLQLPPARDRRCSTCRGAGALHRTPHTPQHALLFAECQISFWECILISKGQQGQAGKCSHDPKPELHVRSLK